MFRDPAIALSLATLAVLHWTTPSFAIDEKLVAVESRHGVNQLFLLLEPDVPPAASVILFPGDTGEINLWKKDSSQYGDDFLVRSRRMFAEQGYLTIVVDVPSDRRGGPGLRDFRDSVAHRADVGAIVEFLRRRAAVPVWLIGTGRGAISAVHLAAHLPVDGIVLTASVTEKSRSSRATVIDAPLDQISRPVLIVHHRSDACGISPYYNVPSLKHRFTGSGIVETLAFEGGDPPISEPCQALSEHGFLGIENRVVAAIARWIKRASPE